MAKKSFQFGILLRGQHPADADISEGFRDLGVRHAPEEPHLHDLGLAGIQPPQLVQRLVEVQQVRVEAPQGEPSLLQR